MKGRKFLMKKISAILLALVMLLSMVAPSFAEEAKDGKITIQNAASGETYKIFKLFDADIADAVNGGDSISYTGTIPDTLKDYFVYQTAADGTTDNIVKADGKTDEEICEALKSWADTQADGTETAKKTGNGSALVFEGLEYGYYVITTTQGTAITVTSTNKEATVYDKNSSEPIVPPEGGEDKVKVVNDDNVTVGDTVNVMC